jgi:hypothetical protein
MAVPRKTRPGDQLKQWAFGNDALRDALKEALASLEDVYHELDSSALDAEGKASVTSELDNAEQSFKVALSLASLEP